MKRITIVLKHTISNGQNVVIVTHTYFSTSVDLVDGGWLDVGMGNGES